MKVLAVVVTFNRCQLLKRCLSGLAAQTAKPDNILVVNNGSTDGTEQMLINESIGFITQENVGSAGGWYTGIQFAVNNGFDAVWLMDDDGYPEAGALEALKGKLSDGVSCVSSIVVKEDNPLEFVFPFPVLDSSGCPAVFALPRKMPSVSELRKHSPNGTYPFVHLFNGALISISAIREIGNVNKNFFIFGDEVDFFFRLRKAGSVFSVLDALHYHPDVSQRPYTPEKVYYYLKNSLILHARYFKLAWIRNILAVLAVLGRVATRNGVGMMVSLLAGTNARIFYSAILRGLQGKVGKDYNG